MSLARDYPYVILPGPSRRFHPGKCLYRRKDASSKLGEDCTRVIYDFVQLPYTFLHVTRHASPARILHFLKDLIPYLRVKHLVLAPVLYRLLHILLAEMPLYRLALSIGTRQFLFRTISGIAAVTCPLARRVAGISCAVALLFLRILFGVIQDRENSFEIEVLGQVECLINLLQFLR